MGGKAPGPPAKEVGTLRPQEPEETVLALGAIPPSGDASQEGHDHPREVEEGRAKGALSVVPSRGPMGRVRPNPRSLQGRRVGAWPGARVGWSGLT